MKFNKLFIPIFLSFVLILGITQPVVAAVKTSEGISNKVFRLHILANSDSTEDQNIKLMLKNYILEKIYEKLSLIAENKYDKSDLIDEEYMDLVNLDKDDTVDIDLMDNISSFDKLDSKKSSKVH